MSRIDFPSFSEVLDLTLDMDCLLEAAGTIIYFYDLLVNYSMSEDRKVDEFFLNQGLKTALQDTEPYQNGIKGDGWRAITGDSRYIPERLGRYNSGLELEDKPNVQRVYSGLRDLLTEEHGDSVYVTDEFAEFMGLEDDCIVGTIHFNETLYDDVVPVTIRHEREIYDAIENSTKPTELWCKFVRNHLMSEDMIVPARSPATIDLDDPRHKTTLIGLDEQILASSNDMDRFYGDFEERPEFNPEAKQTEDSTIQIGDSMTIAVDDVENSIGNYLVEMSDKQKTDTSENCQIDSNRVNL